MEVFGVFFIIIGLPIIFYAVLRGYQMYMMHQQYQAIIAERKQLLDRGVPVEQLPPLHMPEANVISGKVASPPPPVEAPPVKTLVRNPDPIGESIISILLILGGIMMTVAGAEQNNSNTSPFFVCIGFLLLLIGIIFLVKYLISLGYRKDVRFEYASASVVPPVIPPVLPPDELRRRAGDPFINLKVGFVILGIAAGITAMAKWGTWSRFDTPAQVLLSIAFFPAALGIAFLVLQLFLSVMDHRLALIKGIVYLVFIGIACWAFPVLYQPQLSLEDQVQRLGIVPIGVALALFIDFILGRWLEQLKPLQQSRENTQVNDTRSHAGNGGEQREFHNF